jgi:hypothetical protein
MIVRWFDLAALTRPATQIDRPGAGGGGGGGVGEWGLRRRESELGRRVGKREEGCTKNKERKENGIDQGEG